MPFIKLCIFLLILTGCQLQRLSVHTDYIGRESLASYYVRTPDPLLSNPPVGQRLHIYWRLPEEYMAMEDLHLEVTIRFRNQEQIELNIPIHSRFSSTLYSLLNEDFFEKKGILSYKVNLLSENQLLENTTHQLWVEKISFDDDFRGVQ